MTRIVFLASVLALAGCSLWPFGHDKSKEEDRNSSEQMLYRSAQTSLRSGNYRDAIEKLQKLEARFPFGRYAEQAQLELIYANFMSYQPEAVRSAADRFIRLHPQHPNVDYAYYLKGLSEFNRDRGLLDRFASTDISKRDPSSARQSFTDFSELLQRFPESEYAADARLRMIYLVEVLAKYEINVANFYVRRGAYVAAANRARNVVEHYSQSQSVDEALAILVETNWRLGLPDAANDSLRILAINEPSYPAFDQQGDFVFSQQVFDRDRSWLNMMSFGLIDRPEVPPPIEIATPVGIEAPVRPPEPPPTAQKPPSKPWYRRLLG
jgi:outer membrane protein assembly factor BamD